MKDRNCRERARPAVARFMRIQNMPAATLRITGGQRRCSHYAPRDTGRAMNPSPAKPAVAGGPCDRPGEGRRHLRRRSNTSKRRWPRHPCASRHGELVALVGPSGCAASRPSSRWSRAPMTDFGKAMCFVAGREVGGQPFWRSAWRSRTPLCCQGSTSATTHAARSRSCRHSSTEFGKKREIRVSRSRRGPSLERVGWVVSARNFPGIVPAACKQRASLCRALIRTRHALASRTLCGRWISFHERGVGEIMQNL